MGVTFNYALEVHKAATGEPSARLLKYLRDAITVNDQIAAIIYLNILEERMLSRTLIEEVIT